MKSLKTLLKFHDLQDNADTTTIRMFGMPFGGGIEGLYDLHGTYFSQKTDIGPMTRSFDAFFEHGLFPEIGFDPMGVTRIVDEENLEGRIFDVVVNQSSKYHDFLMRLVDEGILFGSAQAFVSGYNVDPETGEVLRFVPAEFSFTVQPSNLLSRPIKVVRNLFKPYGDYNLVKGFYTMPDMTLDNQEQENEVATEETATSTVLEQIEEIIEDDVEAVEESTEENIALTPQEVRSLVVILTEVRNSVIAQNEALAALQEQLNALEGNTNERLDLVDQSLVTFAKSVQSQMKKRILDLVMETSHDQLEGIRRTVVQQAEQEESSQIAPTSPVGPKLGKVKFENPFMDRQ